MDIAIDMVHWVLYGSLSVDINHKHVIIAELLHMLFAPFRVMIHIVAQCHEEGLEHYLRSYVKVIVILVHLSYGTFSYAVFIEKLFFFFVSFLVQYVFKTEPYTSSTTRTVHEELAKAMTAILKPSTDFLTSNKLLKVIDSTALVWKRRRWTFASGFMLALICICFCISVS